MIAGWADLTVIDPQTVRAFSQDPFEATWVTLPVSSTTVQVSVTDNINGGAVTTADISFLVVYTPGLPPTGCVKVTEHRLINANDSTTTVTNDPATKIPFMLA